MASMDAVKTVLEADQSHPPKKTQSDTVRHEKLVSGEMES